MVGKRIGEEEETENSISFTACQLEDASQGQLISNHFKLTAILSSLLFVRVSFLEIEANGFQAVIHNLEKERKNSCHQAAQLCAGKQHCEWSSLASVLWLLLYLFAPGRNRAIVLTDLSATYFILAVHITKECLARRSD